MILSTRFGLAADEAFVFLRWDLIKASLEIRVLTDLETHLNRTRGRTGNQASISATSSGGRIGRCPSGRSVFFASSELGETGSARKETEVAELGTSSSASATELGSSMSATGLVQSVELGLSTSTAGMLFISMAETLNEMELGN
ncbi:unnamed protein product [Linum trigynum]|uniref:Uncharacterized protein n=1 Tax=Linum trigynum TaxID=586398 RepID=A0AAV2D6E1_9ROSI